MIIKPTKEAKEGSIFDIHERAYDFLLYPVREDIPTPMDADIYIEGGNVVIEGSILGSGANTPESSGYCKCILSIEKFGRFYEIEVPKYLIEEVPDILDAIKSAGWIEVK